MADQLQLRGGTTTEHATFTGALREVTVDTDKDTVVVHDNATAGGHPLLREDLSNLPAGTIDNADINANAAIDLSKLATGALPTAITVASANIVDGTIVNADVNASAAIAGTKINPDFGSQNVVTTGTSTAASLIPTGSTVPTTGVYLPDTNTLGLAANNNKRLTIDGTGRVIFNVPQQSTTFLPSGVTHNGGFFVTNNPDDTTFSVNTSPSSLGNAVTLSARQSINQLGGRDLGLDANQIIFSQASTERARIDSSGRLLVGTSTASNFLGAGFPATIQAIETVNQFALGLERATNDNSPVSIQFRKTRSTTPGGVGIVSNNDNLGVIHFNGTDGVGVIQAAYIVAAVDGTPGVNDMPGRLVFATTADGASSPTERMRITNDGRVCIGHNSNVGSLGTIAPLGYIGRSGYSGGSFTNIFNIAWTGSAADLWIDSTNFGAIQVISDYRIKQNVQTQTAPAIERIKLLRPVTYKLKNFESLFQADGIQREGFIAHEVQEVIPSGAEGQKDEENRVQSLRLDAIVSVLTKALQEAVDKIETLEAKVAALEAS
jgi:hypothetical protein